MVATFLPLDNNGGRDCAPACFVRLREGSVRCRADFARGPSLHNSPVLDGLLWSIPQGLDQSPIQITSRAGRGRDRIDQMMRKARLEERDG